MLEKSLEEGVLKIQRWPSPPAAALRHEDGPETLLVIVVHAVFWCMNVDCGTRKCPVLLCRKGFMRQMSSGV